MSVPVGDVACSWSTILRAAYWAQSKVPRAGASIVIYVVPLTLLHVCPELLLYAAGADYFQQQANTLTEAASGVYYAFDLPKLRLNSVVRSIIKRDKGASLCHGPRARTDSQFALN